MLKLGFTLVELMVVTVILTVLLMLAIPSYQDYLRKASAQQAALIMLKDVEYLEKYYALCGNYGRDSASNQQPPCLTGIVPAARVAWPDLPYRFAPQSGTPLYQINFSSQAPSPCLSSNECSGVNHYRLIALPICDTLAARDNQCSCLATPDSQQLVGGSQNCNICVDQDSNITYMASANCGN